MITLRMPDPMVAAMLKKQEAAYDGSIIRPSLYALPFHLEGRKIFCHTMTGQVVETSEYAAFEAGEKLVFDIENAEICELFKAGFLVPETTDEASEYEAVLALLRQMETPPDRCSGYVIIPTTACNARCFYCFEKGTSYETMTPEITEVVIDYIKKTRRVDRPIHIMWFGGEPLLGEEVIDRICEGLRSDGIRFFSTMISNGSLFTEKLVEKAARDWHLDHLEITLDGREEEYNRRKNYRAFSGSPYQAVLHAIHLLLEHRIPTSIRLNIDEDNFSEILKLLDDLTEEFRVDIIKPSMHTILLRKGTTDGIRSKEELFRKREIIDERIRDIRRIWKGYNEETKGVGKTESVLTYHMPRYLCPKDSSTEKAVIFPNGNVSFCHAVKDAPVTGTVFGEALPKDSPCDEQANGQDAECRQCPYAPLCKYRQGCLLPRDTGFGCRESCAYNLRKSLYHLCS